MHRQPTLTLEDFGNKFYQMRIIDGTLVIDLPDADPRAVQIRALLFTRPAVGDDFARLWNACTDSHRAVMRAIAERGEVSQPALEQALGLSGVGLRGRTAGLAKICKRLGIVYPIVSVGSHRESRRFSLITAFRQAVLRRAREPG
jgi:hypothetical protein